MTSEVIEMPRSPNRLTIEQAWIAKLLQEVSVDRPVRGRTKDGRHTERVDRTWQGARAIRSMSGEVGRRVP